MDRGRTRGPGRAQSSVIGVVLIIGMTLAAASVVVMFGSAALEDGRQQSEVGQAEQAMTQFDSRTAQVALGDSAVQTIRLGQGQGRYEVDETAGHITVYHEDWNKSNTSDHREEIYEADLGAVVYENGQTTIAYQGGGVWRHDEDGGSTMVSPPEVHNRQATLTLPIVRVTGKGSSSGHPQATVRSVTRGSPIFPDIDGERTERDQQYDSSSEVHYENPISTGNMTVEIESEYCEAWRSFFLKRTEGRVDDCEDGVVTAQIVALGAQGQFDIAGGGELSIRGIEDMEELLIRMDESSRGSSTFNRLDWTMSAEEGDEDISIWFGAADSAKCGETVQVEVSYSNDTEDHKWRNGTAFPLESSNCDDDLYMEADLLDREVTMQDENGSSSFTLDGTTYNSTNQPALGDVIEYYLEKMQSIDFSISEGNNAYIGDTSSGSIEYEGGGQVVTFLHVTENEVGVTFD